jgi:uncharacterized NAD(P)/FAD-binding protein YdhS
MSQRIAIVGAGFCGTVMAANLLRRPPPGVGEIVLIERQASVGRGLAYAAHEFPYLLNVPAGRLSADSREPLQFLKFAQASMPEAGAEDFLPRRVYGDYLQDFLSRAERAAAKVALTRISGEVTDVEAGEPDASVTLTLADGSTVQARQVILALGNPPPRPLPWAAAVRDHPAYRNNPWDLPAHLSSEHSVLIVGNGLTMVDVAFFLARDAVRTPRMVTVSRRGLVPLTQSAFHPAAMRGGDEFLQGVASIREVVAATRALAREVEQHGGDWREVVTFLRSLAPRIWQRLPEGERRRFVRHVQSYWDVHRHRLPPELAGRIGQLREQGLLEINAGRIDEVTAEGDRLLARWRRRGSAQTHTLKVDAVINATGPDYVVSRSLDPCLRALLRRGLVSEDPLELGLRTAAEGACVSAAGRPHGRLFYLGPMLRAGHWEATAVPELRNHAEALARHLAGDVA